MFEKLKGKLKGNKKKTNQSNHGSSSDRKNKSATQGSGRYKKKGDRTSS